MKYLIALVLALGFSLLQPEAGKGKTVLSKGFARDSATTVTRFTVDQIVVNGDSTLTVLLNNGDITMQIYQDSLPVKVRQGLQRINSDLKAILEK